MLRFEAITNNTAALRCRRILERFGEIVIRLADMDKGFTTVLDCVDVGFIPHQVLDQLPTPSRIGATRVGGVDLNKAGTRAALDYTVGMARNRSCEQPAADAARPVAAGLACLRAFRGVPRLGLELLREAL